MPKSLRLSGKFTGDEVEIIEKIKKAYDVKDNQLVRTSVLSMITNVTLLEAFEKSPKLHKFFRSQMKHYMEKIDDPAEKKRVHNEFSKKFTQKELDQFDSIFGTANTVIKKLNKTKKVGRPRIKRKRGRPKT